MMPQAGVKMNPAQTSRQIWHQRADQRTRFELLLSLNAKKSSQLTSVCLYFISIAMNI
jgi:hypothetical protein